MGIKKTRGENSYKRYSMLYDAAAKQLAAKGKEMYVEKYTKEEYDLQYQLAKSVGEKLTDKMLVSDNKYELSEKQARKIKAAMDIMNDFNRGKHTPELYEKTKMWRYENIEDIRTADLKDFYDAIEKQYWIFKDWGYEGKQAKGMIGQMFFGSI